MLVRLRTPRFAEARARNRWCLVVVLVLWAGQFAMVRSARPYAGWLSVAALAWLLARAYALGRIERRQRRYEEGWLAERTADLRDTWFEVVRFTVHRRGGPDHDRWDESGYELARSADVRELLERQVSERESGRTSRASVEFGFPLPSREYGGLETAYADLAEIEMVAMGRHTRAAGVRFPEAAYHAEGPRARTFWVLGPPLLAVAAPDGGRAAGDRADASAGGGLPR